MHDLPLIAMLAMGLSAALLFGLITQRLGLSPIVGYLLAGVAIGPYTPGFVGDVHIAQQLAEVGIILLMFGVGLHFNVRELLAVKWIAIPGALGQSLIATVCSMALFGAMGMSLKSGAVLGMAMAVASTVVLMRVLMDADVLKSAQGRVAVGWLLVEDVFTVILLVLIPAGGSGDAAAGSNIVGALVWALVKLAVLVAVVMVGGARLIPVLLVNVAKLRSRELFTLTVLVIAIAVAAGSYYFFGASMALGAFLAGMVVAQSPVSHQAAADALPMRDAFAVLFFVSVGILFDPRFLIQHPGMVLAALVIVLLAKPVAALAIVAVLGHSVKTSLTVAVGLAQIGEFSFILSEVARKHHLLPEDSHHAIVAAAIVSITLNPLLFGALPRIEAAIRQRPRLWKLLNGRAERNLAKINAGVADRVERKRTDDKPLAIVVGYGPVGSTVERLLRKAGLHTVVIDMNMETVTELNRTGHTAVYGDASHEAILEQAGVSHAESLVVTLPHSVDRFAVVSAARNINPDLRVLVRARYLKEREHLEQAGATAAVFEEGEAAVALTRLVLTDVGVDEAVIEQTAQELRYRLRVDDDTVLGSVRRTD
jgi:CPA2 family monovalent cation:H+ antiporter-2